MLVISGTTVIPLRYDMDGDGHFESEVAPTVDVNGELAKDQEPPHITFDSVLRGTTAEITIAAQDSASGVKCPLLYSLDDTHFRPYTSPFALDLSMTNTVYVIGDDNVGNRAFASQSRGAVLSVE